jgi:predicted nucleic acid-binding protein
VITYLDTSALLRIVLSEADALDELRARESLISSEILVVESLRAIDRLRLAGALSLESAAARRATLTGWLESVDLVLLQRPILARASEPFPAPLGTLDALHLSTALLLRERTRQAVVLATHDRGLAVAARSFGFEVVGA